MIGPEPYALAMMRLGPEYAQPILFASGIAFAALHALGRFDPGMIGALLSVFAVALAFAVAMVPAGPGARVSGGAAVLLALVGSGMIVLASDVSAALWMWALHALALAGWIGGASWFRGGWARGLGVAAVVALVVQAFNTLRLTSGGMRRGIPVLDSPFGAIIVLALVVVVATWFVAMGLAARGRQARSEPVEAA